MKKTIAPARACTLLIALALILSSSNFQYNSASIVAAQSVTPAALNELSIDDGTGDCILGVAPIVRGVGGFGWVNQLTPTSYPATLRSVSIGFNRTNSLPRQVKRDDLYRIVVYVDPEKDGPGAEQQPDVSFIGRVRGDFESVMTFSLVTPLTIQDGSFVVGVLDDFGVADFAPLYDIPGKSNPAGSESFFTINNGETWTKFSDVQFPGTTFCEHPGSFLIRATVETGPVDTAAFTKIKDPLAVEPWSVLATQQTAYVTNLVSDNMTVIKTTDKTFQNVVVGDGPGGTADGPFGIARIPSADKLFVTLFGSNTVPSKEFPVDYSTVGDGRVAVMTIGSNGALTQALTVNVGKGPRFPAAVPTANGGKIYVPCGGANRVDVISNTTNQKIAEIPVGPDPSSCIASFNNSKIYVTNFGDGSISVIDTVTDKKIKDIPAPRAVLPTPVGATEPPAAALLKNPWNGTVSLVNGNLYITYWGTDGDAFPNGAIAEFNTCSDEFVRATFDDTTRGNGAGSPGVTGIAAPDAPLVLDPVTGTTPGAGGGGGGVFGIAQCDTNLLAFTNDALGIVGLLDTRIDQVVSAPPFALMDCPKPRGISCSIDPNPIAGQAGNEIHLVYVACGQPDNSVIVFNVPRFNQRIPGLPVIESVEAAGKLKIKGEGFTNGITLEVIAPGTLDCLTFEKDLKIKKNGRLIEQKGNLTNGQKPRNIPGALLRFTNTDGTVFIVPISRL